MRQVVEGMFAHLAKGPEIYQPSKFWQQLNEKNVAELEQTGIGGIKRTLAQNYFTWVVGLRSPLFRQLSRITNWREWLDVISGLPIYSREAGLPLRRFYENHIFTRMVWLLAERTDRLGLLDKLIEPDFGNPFDLRFHDRLISQDLAHSVLELYAILEGRMPAFDEPFTVCEVGAGYGRCGYVFLSLFKRCKYVIVDIPPALYVSQEYLSRVLPDRKIMKFRPFSSFGEIREEYEAADAIFLLPHQAELLPAKSVDYFVNISSFHEMKLDQVEAYFKIVDRLTSGYFYLKQWKNFDNVRDGITVKEGDYPFRPNWHALYRRTPPSHPLFFEALFEIDRNSTGAQ